MSISAPWLNEVATVLQRTAGETLLTVDLAEARTVLDQMPRALPLATSPAERLLLRGLLLEFACRTGLAIQRLIPTRDSPVLPDCGMLGAYLSRLNQDPHDAFGILVDDIFSELTRRHPPAIAVRAAQQIRFELAAKLDVPKLAGTLHVSTSQLRRAFHRHFNISLRDYQITVRTIAACDAIDETKNEVIALQVGYRSKKDFYRVFRRLTKLTPAAFRRLSLSERHQINRSLLRTVSPVQT